MTALYNLKAIFSDSVVALSLWSHYWWPFAFYQIGSKHNIGVRRVAYAGMIRGLTLFQNHSYPNSAPVAGRRVGDPRTAGHVVRVGVRRERCRRRRSDVSLQRVRGLDIEPPRSARGRRHGWCHDHLGAQNGHRAFRATPVINSNPFWLTPSCASLGTRDVSTWPWWYIWNYFVSMLLIVA